MEPVKAVSWEARRSPLCFSLWCFPMPVAPTSESRFVFFWRFQNGGFFSLPDVYPFPGLGPNPLSFLWRLFNKISSSSEMKKRTLDRGSATCNYNDENIEWLTLLSPRQQIPPFQVYKPCGGPVRRWSPGSLCSCEVLPFP